jgi:hypothetical protein
VNPEMTQLIIKPENKENIAKQEKKVKGNELEIKEKRSLSKRKKYIGLIRNFIKLFNKIKVLRINIKAFYYKENKTVPNDLPYFNIERFIK